MVCIVAIHSRSLVAAARPNPDLAVEAATRLEVEPGQTGEHWLRERLKNSPGQAIVAADGQATHHVLGMPVVSIIEPEFSTTPFDAGALRSRMQRFHARYLLLYPGARDVPVQDHTPLLRRLLTGDSPEAPRTIKCFWTRAQPAFSSSCGDPGGS